MSDLSRLGSYGEIPSGLGKILLDAFGGMQAEEAEQTERYDEDNGIKTSYIFSPSRLPYGAVMLLDDYKGVCVVPYTFVISAAAMIEVALEEAKDPSLFSEANPYNRLRSNVQWGLDKSLSTVFSVDAEGRGFYCVTVMREGSLSETFCIHHEDFPQFIADVKAVMDLEDKWREEATGITSEPKFSECYEDAKRNIVESFLEMFLDDDEDETNEEGFPNTMPSSSDLPVAVIQGSPELPEHLM